jgi:hypothetical protein
MCFDGLDLDYITPINESNIYTKCVICNCHKCKLNIEIQIKITNVKEDISISIKQECPLTPMEDECPLTPMEDKCPLTPMEDKCPLTPMEDEYPLTPMEDEYPLTPMEDEYPLTPMEDKCPLTPIEDKCPLTPMEDKCHLTPINNDISYENIDIVEEEQKKVVKKINIKYIRGYIYTKEERQEAIRRYKNKKRNYNKRTLYKCRKTFADSRPRVGGRFVCLYKKKKL